MTNVCLIVGKMKRPNDQTYDKSFTKAAPCEAAFFST